MSSSSASMICLIRVLVEVGDKMVKRELKPMRLAFLRKISAIRLWKVPTLTRLSCGSVNFSVSFSLRSLAAARVKVTRMTLPTVNSLRTRTHRPRTVVVFPVPAPAIPVTFLVKGALIRAS